MHSVDTEWRKALKDKEVMNYFSAEGIRWKYRIALVPWQGGFYKRLVGLVKRCMRKSIGKKYFYLEQLAMLLAEIEAVLNSRPLRFIYKDLDSGFTLTPGQFLVTNRKLALCNSSDAEYHYDEDY